MTILIYYFIFCIINFCMYDKFLSHCFNMKYEYKTFKKNFVIILFIFVFSGFKRN